jgi:hypothetical protein
MFSWGKRADAAGPGFIFEDRRQSAFGIASSPTPHLHFVLSEPEGDLLVLQPIGGQENDGGSLLGADGTGSAALNAFQFHAFLIRQFDGRGNSRASILAACL